MKRIMSMLLSTALVFTLTACGSGNGDSQSSAVTETTQEMQKESTANEGENTASEENAKLKLMYWESAYTEPLKQAVAGFQESHPGVTVELEVLQETMKQYFFQESCQMKPPIYSCISEVPFLKWPRTVIGEAWMREARG